MVAEVFLVACIWSVSIAVSFQLSMVGLFSASVFFFLCVSICYSILQRFSAYVRFKSPTNVEQEWAKNRDGINDNGNVDAIESRVNEMDRQHMNGISNFENHRKRFRFVSHFV